ITVIISDNSTAGMTGGQTSSAFGRIVEICKGLGVDPEHIHVTTPIKKNHEENVAILKKELAYQGVSVIIPQRECIQTFARRRKSERNA
ncbi:MAG: indolepyruvate ferredoxin oxidoreductase, partial [Bacteroidales bacterium]|nr:indolepyruvate ferredoxin oxidoreductase [Bacteroidales bacterium]